MERQEPQAFKLILLGDAGVGKTSIVNRRCYGKFDDKLAMTVGVSSVSTLVQVSGRNIELKIWDTAGQEQYTALIPMFSRNSNVCVLVADATNPATLSNLAKWEDILHQSECNPPIIVAVNKTDLVTDMDSKIEEISEEVMTRFSRVVFVSAKNGSGIDILFRMAGDLAITDGTSSSVKSVSINGGEEGSSCC